MLLGTRSQNKQCPVKKKKKRNVTPWKCSAQIWEQLCPSSHRMCCRLLPFKVWSQSVGAGQSNYREARSTGPRGRRRSLAAEAITQMSRTGDRWTPSLSWSTREQMSREASPDGLKTFVQWLSLQGSDFCASGRLNCLKLWLWNHW